MWVSQQQQTLEPASLGEQGARPPFTGAAGGCSVRPGAQGCSEPEPLPLLQRRVAQCSMFSPFSCLWGVCFWLSVLARTVTALGLPHEPWHSQGDDRIWSAED